MAQFIQVLETPTAGKAGHIASSSKGYTGSTIVRVADANTNEGLGVVEGTTAGKSFKVPASAAEVASGFLGVTIDPEFKNDINAAASYLAGDQASILEEGEIWVTVENAVAVNDKVCVRHTSDGGSNTVLGKFTNKSDYPAGGIIATPVAATASAGNHYSLTLFDGVVRETYAFNTDASPTAQEIVEGLAAAINAGTAFDATEDDSALSITSVTGLLEIDSTSQFVLTAPARCARIAGAKFRSATSGAGVAKIRLPAK